MQVLKKIGLGLLALLVVLTLVSFFLPRQVHVERSRVMAASPHALYEQVNTLRNWEQWSPWHKIDPQMGLTYSGPAAGPGATYSWTSKDANVGNGRLEILRAVPDQRIDTRMDFMENGTATSTYLFESEAAGTKVTWMMDSDMGLNPAARYMGLLMDRLVGSDFERGLESLEQAARHTPGV